MEHSLPHVAVVILNYNTRHYLERFIPSILATNYPNFEVIVADNGSDDDSLEFLEQAHPTVRRLILEDNYGFAEGYNQALKRIECAYCVLLNSDVEVPPTWLTPLVETMLSDPSIAAVQPKIRDLNQPIKFEYAGASGGFIDRFGYTFCRGRIFNELEEDHGQYDNEMDVFWATGAALLIRKSVYTKLGGLDADFFAHMEEIDLCWRMHNHNYRIVVQPKSFVLHMGGGTLASQSAHKTYLNFRNNLAMLAKNLPPSLVYPMLIKRLVLDGVAGLRFVFKGEFTHVGAIVRAHWNFFRQISMFRKKTQNMPKQHLSKLPGFYRKSLIVQHFLRGKKTFSSLKPELD
ncbi:MAG: GT2 family glycosyltransferase [Bacteroidia bacterium]|jgi:GT2 family glycosyltransferase